MLDNNKTIEWKLTPEEIAATDTDAKSLRYLWVFSAASFNVVKWHQRMLTQRKQLGYKISGICNTFPEEGYRWYDFPTLDAMWRSRHPLLMKLYASIASAMEHHDVLILYNGANLHPEFVSQLPGYKVYTFGDPESWDNLAGPIGPAFDLHLANQPRQIEKFLRYGMNNVFFCPLGSQFFPEDFPDVSGKTLLDKAQRPLEVVMFCGKTPWRAERLDALVAHFPDALVKGHGWKSGMASDFEVIDSYRKAQIGWNMHNTDGFAFRTYDLAALGAMQLCDCKQDLLWILEDGQEVIGYDNVADCVDKTRYYLEHKDEQRIIALNAWKKYVNNYSPAAIWDYMVHRIANGYKNKKIDVKSKCSSLQVDLAGCNYWDDRYEVSVIASSWAPTNYLDHCLEKIIDCAFATAQPKNVLEVGCGGSTWLGYLAKKYAVPVAGLDYSKSGCDLARARLAAEGVTADVFCADLFTPPRGLSESFDLVYSLGVAEHFDHTADVIRATAQFVRPGGFVLTEVPNMYKSFHMLLSRIWQPQVLEKHVRLSLDMLAQAHEEAGLELVEQGYKGLFSFGLVAWGVQARWPRLEKRLLPFISRGVDLVERIMLRKRIYTPRYKSFSPFMYVIARKR